MPIRDFPTWHTPRRRLDLPGFLLWTGFFFAIFLAWADGPPLVSADPQNRVTLAAQIFSALCIAAALDGVTGTVRICSKRAISANRALLGSLLTRARGAGGGATGRGREQGKNLLVPAAAFVVSGFLPRLGHVPERFAPTLFLRRLWRLHPALSDGRAGAAP